MKGVFVTGIGTGIGKTLVSAILTEALYADYWKPVQAGELNDTDTMFVQNNIANDKSFIHPEKYRLNTPASPHFAARKDGVNIQLSDFSLPKTDNFLVVEGAGGLLVPLNDDDLIIDLIEHLKLPVVVVSQYYLGSINHTLLTVQALQARGIEMAGLVFNGTEVPSTKEVILHQTGLPVLGELAEESVVNKEVVMKYAAQWRPQLQKILKL